MPDIKVTGVLHTEDMNPEFVDLDDTTGLSGDGHLYFTDALDMDDVEFVLVKDGDES